MVCQHGTTLHGCVSAWVLVESSDAKPMDREGRLYQPFYMLGGFWHPRWLQEPIPYRYRETTVQQFIPCTQMRGNQGKFGEGSRGQIKDFRKFSLGLFSLFLPFSELWCYFFPFSHVSHYLGDLG